MAKSSKHPIPASEMGSGREQESQGKHSSESSLWAVLGLSRPASRAALCSDWSQPSEFLSHESGLCAQLS